MTLPPAGQAHERGIEAIIFDAEGVVIDTESIWDEGQRVFLERRGIAYDRAFVKPRLTGRSLADGVRALQAEYGFAGDPDELAEERAQIVRGLMRTAGFVPGFTTFFERVAGEYRVCIATAMQGALFDVVDERLGLRRLFGERVFTIADVGFRSKPDPALFLYAAARLAVAPAACVVIEDAPLGIEAARRAGMRCVGLATTYEPPLLSAADQVARTYDEIALDEIEPRAQVG